MSTLLAIESLSIALPHGADRAYAVDDVSITIAENEIVCLVGESGSGKSMTAHAVLGLLPPQVTLAAGRIVFRNSDLSHASPAELRRIRGGEIGMIFQEPLSALNPLMRVGDHVGEAIVVHDRDCPPREAAERAIDLLAAVGLPDPRVIAKSYPFQLSGGQRQRVMIAGALANNPRLLLADEPTTALDVTTQRQILDLIHRLKDERRMAVMFITHDFGVVAEIANRVVVMREGRVVEIGSAAEVLQNPQHPYTRALIEAVPGRRRSAAPGQEDKPLLTIEGLRKCFVRRQSWFGQPRRVTAADDVSFTLSVGQTVAVVGESGSGKSTLARMILRLVRPDGGRIRFAGRDALRLSGSQLRAFRRDIQIVFQDPFASLNPRQKIGEAIARGPIAFGTPPETARADARALLALVGLDAAAADRYPHEFSGGQRQRISIARALALKPKLLVADEPVSALDVSIQAQVLELLAELKREFHLAMLFVTHDLRVAAEIADDILVMRNGRIVEHKCAAELFANPQDSYTRKLLDAIPGRSLLPSVANASKKLQVDSRNSVSCNSNGRNSPN